MAQGFSPAFKPAFISRSLWVDPFSFGYLSAALDAILLAFYTSVPKAESGARSAFGLRECRQSRVFSGIQRLRHFSSCTSFRQRPVDGLHSIENKSAKIAASGIDCFSEESKNTLVL